MYQRIRFRYCFQQRFGVLSNAVQEMILGLDFNNEENRIREQNKIIAALSIYKAIENGLNQITILFNWNIRDVNLTPKEIEKINDPEIRNINFNTLEENDFKTLYNMHKRILYRHHLELIYRDLSNDVQERILGLNFNDEENLGIEQDNIIAMIRNLRQRVESAREMH